MPQFRTRRSFGPHISLTERQQEQLAAKVRDAGLTCFIENCPTGSVYVAIDLPTWQQNIRGEWFSDLDCGCGEGIAKIRLSGHDEGKRTDATHNAVGSKTLCMSALRRWITEIVEKHGERGRAILTAGPPS